MGIDPIKTSKSIKINYLSYLETAFPISNSDLADQFRKQLHKPDGFVKGPILEGTPPFQLGCSIADLIEEEILSREFYRLSNDHLPVSRQLYKHQEKAIRKLIFEHRNVVVTTGTGSGKTEVFLIPIINHLLREREKGYLTDGVRALLLYPMNALANDQMKRLRRILMDYPYITFGRYTGETKESKQEADDHFLKNFPDEPRVENEQLSREEMRLRPPNILLTNYAMLEYLLLRPKDTEFFDGEKARYWKYLVIDEVHTYDGAKGIEVAMLLRRLKDRIVNSEQDRLQCIATSATLGKGRADYPKVAQFATNIFGKTFEWVEGNPSKQDIIEAIRESVAKQSIWGAPDPSIYKLWCKQMDDDSVSLQTLVNTSIEKGVPKVVTDSAVANASNNSMDIHSKSRFLFEILSGDKHFNEIRERLEESPCYLEDLSKHLFQSINSDEALNALISLVDLASKAKLDEDSRSILPARYHLFVRALEGAYLSLAPKKELYLDRRQLTKRDGREYIVYEIATCRQCGHIYLVGETKQENGKRILKQTKEISEENLENAEYYFLREDSDNRNVPENEDELTHEDEESKAGSEQVYVLCACCGAIDQEGLLTPLCECKDANDHRLTVQKVPTRNRTVNHCLSCGSRSQSLVGRFLTGQDAPVSVLATALYQELPPRIAAGIEEVENSNNGRQLLIFSDSRQDAAFFACYLDRTYNNILRRRLIIHTLNRYKTEAISNQWRVEDLVNRTCNQARELMLFSSKSSKQQQIDEAWRWLLLELLSYDRRNNLQGLGLLGFSLAKPQNWKAPKPLLENPWELTEDESWTLFQILLDSFRIQGAITFPDNVNPEDDIFYPRNFSAYFRENGSSTKNHINSWASASGNRLNRRLDFILKLSAGSTNDKNEYAKQILSDIWKESLFKNGSYWREYFLDSPVQNEGRPYRLKYEMWEIQPGCINPAIKWYQCDTCGNLSLHNLRNICPTYSCEGSLKICDPDEIFRNNHYRQHYLNLNPMPLVAEEHTAQLTSESAAGLQDKFTKGEINVLSCSTTFELGVDVGELEAVLMRNVPPSAANYIQRAGRAGRRTDSTAFAVTFAQRRSHDLTHYNDPIRIVSGKIHAPFFEIRNEIIVRRHIHSLALGAFWRNYPHLFGNVDSFFFTTEESGPEQFEKYLRDKPKQLQNAVQRIVPSKLHKPLGVNDWLWLDGLFDEKIGTMKLANDEIRHDVKSLNELRDELIKKREDSDYVNRMIKTLTARSIIDYLSNRNVLPKYGFPVDVVELQILHHGQDASRLQLTRDLRIALSEYAPQNEIVAGGKLWESYALKKLPNKEWPKYEYAICNNCQFYQRVLADAEKLPEKCKACNTILDGQNVKGYYVIPEFGFLTSRNSPGRPGESRPNRSYSSRVYFSGDSKLEGIPCELQLNGVNVIATASRDGKMAVLNRGGYRICSVCGYGIRSGQKISNPHKNPLGRDCKGTLMRVDLGHEFRSDVLDLKFRGCSIADRGFWLSLLYALLEGASESIEVSRDDLDGCLYPYEGDPTKPAIILFDDVPGGAGHVKRIAESKDSLRQLIEKSMDKVKCQRCGEETSCYNCLRNYHNQYCHDELKRGLVKEFLERILLN